MRKRATSARDPNPSHRRRRTRAESGYEQQAFGPRESQGTRRVDSFPRVLALSTIRMASRQGVSCASRNERFTFRQAFRLRHGTQSQVRRGTARGEATKALLIAGISQRRRLLPRRARKYLDARVHMTWRHAPLRRYRPTNRVRYPSRAAIAIISVIACGVLAANREFERSQNGSVAMRRRVFDCRDGNERTGLRC